jgi:subtilisin family serine protease
MKSDYIIGSLLRDYMARQSAGRRVDLAGISIGGKLAGMFVENDVLVNQRDDKSIAFLVDSCGGTVVPAKPLPERPRELANTQRREIIGMPQMVTVKVKGDAVPLDALKALIARETPEDFQMSSRSGAGTLAASLLLREKGLGGQLNLAGTPDGFPLPMSSEASFPGDNNAFAWPEYSGKTNIAKAWQLCQALDNVRAMKHPIFIGILDVGYGFVPPFDYATGTQFNLVNEGASIVGVSSNGWSPYHGSSVAGVAAAIINNNIGAGGVGGLPVGPANLPVAIPFMFRTDIVISEIYRCLQCCVAWGIDVLNMSFSMSWPKLFLPMSGDWDDNFQFAKDQGLIMIASGGNDGFEIPDNVLFPATRTPGVITVGWLDSSLNAAHPKSNYGSSVDVWAPGTSLHTVPNPSSPSVFFSGTSAAAPVIAGVAALLRSVNPMLKSDDVKALLRDTAWTDSPDWKSNRIINAYEAVLKAINYALPAGIFEEPNDSPGTAKQMIQKIPNIFQPLSETVISRGTDVDFHRFTLAQYSDVMVVLNFVRPLSIVVIEVIPEDPDSLAFDQLVDNRGPGVQVLSFKQAPPGNYLIKVRSVIPNYYTLSAQITPKALEPDVFESNQTKDKAARVHLRKREPTDFLGVHAFYQGAYEATIETPSDMDWYHVTDIKALTLSFPCFKVLNSDAPLDVTLFGPDGTSFGTSSHVKHLTLHLPEPECWIEVRSSKATRYSIFFGYMLDKSKLPPPHERDDVEIVPEWWPDPPFVLNEWEKWLELTIDERLRAHGVLELQSDRPIEWDLLSTERTVLQSSVRMNVERQLLNVRDLAPGKYLLRVGRESRAAARFEAAQRAVIKFGVGPAFSR